MRIIVYYIIYMQFYINLINIHVLSHYCCIFGLKGYNVVAIRLVYICFVGLHGSHANKLTSSSSSAHTNGDCSDTQTKACLRT